MLEYVQIWDFEPEQNKYVCRRYITPAFARCDAEEAYKLLKKVQSLLHSSV